MAKSKFSDGDYRSSTSKIGGPSVTRVGHPILARITELQSDHIANSRRPEREPFVSRPCRKSNHNACAARGCTCDCKHPYIGGK